MSPPFLPPSLHSPAPSTLTDETAFSFRLFQPTQKCSVQERWVSLSGGAGPIDQFDTHKEIDSRKPNEISTHTHTHTYTLCLYSSLYVFRIPIQIASHDCELSLGWQLCLPHFLDLVGSLLIKKNILQGHQEMVRDVFLLELI